ncbi:hypothetical protein [Streptomyces sp. NBC_00996]|uniref:hypothetical protein n=1 Tax=Streptomyces sp. NBC_00996 TaxID=2903710 RepID=UPI003864BED2|nr:hypothetical protein OG390_34710 [Streptomyces sp. NBC_00996]
MSAIPCPYRNTGSRVLSGTSGRDAATAAMERGSSNGRRPSASARPKGDVEQGGVRGAMVDDQGGSLLGDLREYGGSFEVDAHQRRHRLQEPQDLLQLVLGEGRRTGAEEGLEDPGALLVRGAQAQHRAVDGAACRRMPDTPWKLL